MKTDLHMKRSEIEKMPAGMELDALVAEKFMGWRLVDTPSNDWFIDRSWSDLADDIFWCDSMGCMHANDHGYSQFSVSTDIAVAWPVLAKLRQMFFRVMLLLCRRADIYICAIVLHPGPEYDGILPNIAAEAGTAPLAICRVALLAVLDTTGHPEEKKS